MKVLNGLALCAGIGGLERGISAMVPHRTVCYVEREGYAAACLVARMEKGELDPAPLWNDVKTFRGKPWRGVVDLATAGYPCQPFSVAGRRGGEDDPRHLWPHIARIIAECQPALCFFENVPGHVSIGLEQVRADLQGMGYHVSAGIFSAAEIGAPHLRQRLFILAHTDRTIIRRQPWQHGGTRGEDTSQSGIHGAEESLADTDDQRQLQSCGGFAEFGGRARNGCEVMANAFSARRNEGLWVQGGSLRQQTWGSESKRRSSSVCPRNGWWKSEPDVGRMVDGLPHRVDRLRSLGNAVVPATAALAFSTLLDEAMQ